MTQNLNYETIHSYPYTKRENNRKYVVTEGGRAYKKPVVFEACCEGWDVPTLDDFFTLAFSLGKSLYVINNEYFFYTDAMFGDFRPYLEFGQYLAGGTYWVKFKFLTGTSYWTKSFDNQYNNTESHIKFCWTEHSSDGGGLEVVYFDEERDGVPLRCIKRKSKKNREFSSINSNIIKFGDVELKLSDLPAEGIYGKKGENSMAFTNPVLILYIGTKMFLLVGQGTQKLLYNTNEFLPLRISYSKDSGRFILSNFSASSSSDIGTGEVQFHGDKIIFNYQTDTESFGGEYNGIPSAKVSGRFWR